MVKAFFFSDENVSVCLINFEAGESRLKNRIRINAINFHNSFKCLLQAGESTINLKGMIIGNGEVSFKQDVS